MAEAPSEMSSISLYAYNQLITIFIATFHEISIVEMHPPHNLVLRTDNWRISQNYEHRAITEQYIGFPDLINTPKNFRN